MKKIYYPHLFLTLFATLFTSLKSYASAPTPTYGSAIVDGSTGDWSIPSDFFADMFEAGKSDKALLSKLYVRYDCATGTVYVLVLTQPGVIADNSPDDAFVKLGNSTKLVDGTDNNDGTPPDFAWVTSDGNKVGYEASFKLTPGSYNNFNVHINVGGGRTSRVDDKFITLELSCPLPVNLISFNARNEDELVRLQWQSSSEEAFEAYLVERSTNAVQFTSVGRVNAKGATKATTNYVFTDAELPKNAATLYYRLKLLDTDGTFSYSKIQSVQRKILTLGLTALTNPVRHAAYLTVSSPVSQSVQVVLINNQGKEIQRMQINVAEGQTPLELNVQGLPPGIYFATVSNGITRRSVRLLIR